MPDETPDANVPDAPEDAPAIDLTIPEIQAAIRAATAEAMKPLTANRDKLLAEAKQAKADRASLVESLGGEEGVEHLRELRAKAQDGELQKLLETGKLDQYKRAVEEAAAKPFQAKVADLEKRAAELEQGRDAEANRRRAVQRNIDLTNAALKAGVEEKYVGKIVQLTEAQFNRDDELDATIGADGSTKPLDFYESDAIRDEFAVFFKGSQGAGAVGGPVAAKGKRRSEMTEEERFRFVDAHGPEAWAKVPA